MKKCIGCGAILQNKDPLLDGYTEGLEKEYCERCFRIQNYGEYKKVLKDNDSFFKILDNINKTNDLVLLVVDLFSMNNNLKQIINHLNNDILLVLTKRDILPLSLKDEKLLNYDLGINVLDKVVISSNKNYGMDNLFDKINKYKKSNNVYIVGYTNAGKSTLINKLIYNYSDLSSNITTSILPSTTLDTIEIKLNEELTLIDTPGILDGNDFIYNLDSKELKKILPKKEIKPITYQIKNKQYIYIEELVKIESSNNNLTFFISNTLSIQRLFKDKEEYSYLKEIEVDSNQDIVISGLGFIKVSKKEKIKIYTKYNMDIYTRDSLI